MRSKLKPLSKINHPPGFFETPLFMSFLRRCIADFRVGTKFIDTFFFGPFALLLGSVAYRSLFCGIVPESIFPRQMRQGLNTSIGIGSQRDLYETDQEPIGFCLPHEVADIAFVDGFFYFRTMFLKTSFGSQCFAHLPPRRDIIFCCCSNFECVFQTVISF